MVYNDLYASSMFQHMAAEVNGVLQSWFGSEHLPWSRRLVYSVEPPQYRNYSSQFGSVKHSHRQKCLALTQSHVWAGMSTQSHVWTHVLSISSSSVSS